MVTTLSASESNDHPFRSTDQLRLIRPVGAIRLGTGSHSSSLVLGVPLPAVACPPAAGGPTMNVESSGREHRVGDGTRDRRPRPRPRRVGGAGWCCSLWWPGCCWEGWSVSLLGPHSLSPGPRFSGDQLLAGDFRATLDSDRGLGSVEVARLRDGKVTYAGLAPDGTAPPTPQTPFELGSITKTMTGMLLADAVRRGEMRLDAPVSDYLPELVGTPAGAATLEQLATHHSGLPALPSHPPTSSVLAVWGNANPYAMSVETLLQLTRDTPLGTPGHFAYSNLGMSLLGHAEARAAGAADWPALARQRLLVPLGMTNTTFVTAADQIPAGTATPHKDNGWRAPHWYGAAFTPAGTSTYTTAEDMMKYARAVVEGQAPGLAALEPVADADQGRIGLAWITSDVSGRTLTWHNGNTGGYRSMLALDRADRPSRPGAEQLHALGRRSRAAACGGRIRRRVGSHRTTRPWPRSDRGPPRRSGAPGVRRGRPAPNSAPDRCRPRCRRRRRRAGAVTRTRAVGPATGGTVVSPGRAGPGQRHSRLPPLQGSPVGPERRRWASITAVGIAALLLLAAVWTA